MENHNLKILAIDDNDDNLTVLKAVVRDAFPDAKILTALNGVKGVELALSMNPDVILLDIVMPEMDGFEVCRRLKGDERLKHIPVIFLTALKTDRESRINALEAGAEGFLGKPFDPEELTAQIRAMAKIKAANEFVRIEKEQLALMVAERTVELEKELAERKKAEAALKESEQKYRTLFENSPVGIILIDVNGRILEVNQSLLNSLGSPSLEATKAINMFEFPELIEAGVSDLFRSCISSGRHVNAELPYTSKWDKPTYMRLLLTPMKDIYGNIYGCQGVLEDVSEQKKLETKLNHAQKMEAVGTLAGGIAHDFNNLLQVILGYSELFLAQKKLEDPDYMGIENIYRSACSGADLVKRLMMFSRKIEPELIQVDLNSQIKQTEKFLSRTIPKMIDVQLELSDDIGKINADPTQIEQIILNLGINARDAMPNGGKLTIGSQKVFLDERGCNEILGATPGIYVRLTVSDTGCGMDTETVNRIFEPFFTTKELGRGTGLGLATVYGIVQKHCAHISCHSEPSKGTVFKIYFPCLGAE